MSVPGQFLAQSGAGHEQSSTGCLTGRVLGAGHWEGAPSLGGTQPGSPRGGGGGRPGRPGPPSLGVPVREVAPKRPLPGLPRPAETRHAKLRSQVRFPPQPTTPPRPSVTSRRPAGHRVSPVSHCGSLRKAPKAQRSRGRGLEFRDAQGLLPGATLTHSPLRLRMVRSSRG